MLTDRAFDPRTLPDASALGTMVLRYKLLPPRPVHLDGVCIVLGVKGGALDPTTADGAAAEAALRDALGTYGTLTQVECVEGIRWRARFATHSQAVAAAGAFASRGDAKAAPDGVAALFCAHTDRSYAERGWTTFESALSVEAISRLEYYPQLAAALSTLPPKLVEIDGEQPVAVEVMGSGDEGAGPHIRAVRAAIRGAKFTGPEDREVVLRLYDTYIMQIGNAMTLSGEVGEVVHACGCRL